MPSLLTARTAGGPSHGRTLSKVNSFTRKWDDDDEEPSSSSRIDWSPSPEQTRTKAKPMEVEAVVGETAAERRRKAIMAALEPNTILGSNPLPKASTSTSIASASNRKASTLPLKSGREALVGMNRELPSIPKDLQVRKRQLPWDEEMMSTKKATRTASTGSTSSKRSNSGPGLEGAHKGVPKTFLSVEQQQVLGKVVGEGANIFYTGSAGTGKSVLLREIITGLRKKHVQSPDAVAVTASTGIAACNIGGVTLHSFGGVGLALEEPNVLLGKLKKNKKAVARWLRTKALIIDEISMVDGEMFDKFNKLGQMIRKNPNKPFGGIQIIVTGDFFQLPPVTKGGAQPKFCFDAQTWAETMSMSVNLTKVFRQKDQRFVDMLNEMRFGKLSQASIAAFRALARPIEYDDGIEPTVLFPRREDVDRANETKLKGLNGDGWSYPSSDGGAVTDLVQRAKLLANFMAPETLYLKTNAQVMLIKNLDETLVNGSMGKVMGFEYRDTYVVGKYDEWLENGIPEEIEGDEADNKRIQRTHMIQKLRAAGQKPNPVVRFKIPGGNGKMTRDLLVEPDSFKAELPNGEVQASRLQLPLILSWAMSIHKSQGQTLDRVKVDLGKVFEKGQAYVALSRATSLEGLQVLGFNADKVQAHKRVAVWSKDLMDLNRSSR